MKIIRAIGRWIAVQLSWYVVGDRGCWRYEVNSRTYGRRARKVRAGHSPKHVSWLNGGPWKEDEPKPPTGGSSAVRAPQNQVPR